jgi:selenide, water dikinase
MEIPKLTQFSPGAGCGCKISSSDLKKIINKSGPSAMFPELLVGYESSDDAAVFDLGNENALISTTDFFTPIVDDPYDYGRIAATNAISDVYAMGGKPLIAISILGWPLEKLPAQLAAKVIEGAEIICNEAGIPLAGGHSINISDPIFGLAVTGIITKENIKQNNKATSQCLLFLTKPLGLGLITTAEKHGIASIENKEKALEVMTTSNKLGYHAGFLKSVKAMTDVTGFGLLGHLLEICEGSNLSAILLADKIPVLDGILHYIEKKAIPGGTFRNWKSYGHEIDKLSEIQKMIYCDPQTSGGLLIAVEKDDLHSFLECCRDNNTEAFNIGYLKEYDGNKRIYIQ